MRIADPVLEKKTGYLQTKKKNMSIFLIFSINISYIFLPFEITFDIFNI